MKTIGNIGKAKRLFVMAATACCLSPAWAAEEAWMLMAEGSAGEVVSVALAEKPALTVGGRGYVLCYGWQRLEYGWDELRRLWLQRQESSGLDAVRSGYGLRVMAGEVVFTSLNPHSDVLAYSADGRLLLRRPADASGTLRVPTRGLPSGQVVVFRTSRSAFKLFLP